MMESSSTESQGGKDLLQQALDLSAIGEEECMGAQQDQADADNQFGSGCNIEGKVREFPNTDVLQTQKMRQTGVSEKNDRKNVRLDDSAASGDKREVTPFRDGGTNLSSNPCVETVEKRVNLVIPKIPSVVVRNENNDIIEQMNEPDGFSKPGNASASVRQTLKSKIMEKSKSLDMSETAEHKSTSAPQNIISAISDETKGLSNSASSHTHRMEKSGSENSDYYGDVDRKNEKIDLNQVSVNIPSVASVHQIGPAKYDTVGPVISTMQQYIAPMQGTPFNAAHVQPGLVTMNQGGAFYSPRMIPYAQPMMITTVAQQMNLMNHQPQIVQQPGSDQPSTRMPGMPLGAIPSGAQGSTAQGNFALGQFRGGPMMQQVPGFIPMRFPPYPQNVLSQQSGRGPIVQNPPRSVVPQSANPVNSTASNIISPSKQDVQSDTTKNPNNSTDSESVQLAENKIINNTKESPEDAAVDGTKNNSFETTAAEKSSISSESTFSAKSVVSTKGTVSTESVVSTDSSISTESTVSTESTISTENTISAKSTVSTESTVSTKSTVSAVSTASMNSTISAESTISTKSTISSESTFSTEKAVSTKCESIITTLSSIAEAPIQTTTSSQSTTRTVSSVTTTSASSSSSTDSQESQYTKPFELVRYKSNTSSEDAVSQFSFYKCDKCRYKTKYRANFRKHYSRHLDYRPYSCEYCEFQTYYSLGITKHMTTHIGQDPNGFYYFPDSALEKAIEFHCDDCKEVKWVNDDELAELKKDILFVPKKSKKLSKTYYPQNVDKSESKPSNLKRKADVLVKNETPDVKVKKRPGRKPKYKVVEEVANTAEEEVPTKIKEDETEEKMKEDSETEDDEDVSSKKIPNYEIVDATNILETPKRKRKFKTLFDPSPELYQTKKFAHLTVTDGSEKFTPPMRKSSKLKCPYCPYKSDSPIGIRRHAFWRHKSYAYCCDNCPFKAKSSTEVLAHCEKEHPKMIPTVKKVFDQGLSQDRNVGEDQDGEGNEETNEEEKEDKEEKECREEEKSDDKDKSENNVEEKNSKDEDKTEIRPLRKGKIESLKTKSLFQCTQCPYKSNALGVQSHMLRRHNICQYFCGVCAFESENEAIVTEHFKKEHPTDDLAISRGFVKLNTSENKTDILAKKKPKKICAIRTLKRSKDTARFKPAGVQGPKRDSPAECPICGFKSRYSGVQRHISMIHGLLKWQCGKCGIQLFSKGETFEHSLTVHDTHAPCVIRSFFEVEKIKELKDSNSLIVEKNGKVKIGAPGEGMVVKSTPKQAAHVEPTTPTKSKKEEIVKDTQCPECSFSSNVKGVQRHLMLIHKICRWQCKICGFGSLDKHVTLEHSVDMHEGIDPKIVRAFVDIDRYNAEKRLNASDEQELQNQSANRQEYLFDFDDTSSNENYMDDTSEKTLDPPVVEKSDVKAVSPHTSLKSKEEKSAAKLSEPQSKKLSKSLSSPAAVSLDAPVFSPAEVAKKRTKTPSPRALSLDVPASSATGDSENEMPTKKKRGRPKGSGTAFKGTVAIPKKEVSSTFVLKPKELNLLQQGFSCVYCVYAAPLRHQVRLHCYDKHTNHPACLMEFKVDTHGFRSDGVIDLVGDSTDSYIKGKGKSENAQVETQADGNMKAKKQKACDNSEDMEVDQPAVKKSKLSTDTKQNSTEKDSKLEELKENMNEIKDKNACLENGFKSGKDISEGKSDSLDTASTHSGQDMEVDELHISEIFDNGKRFKSNRKQRKKFDNPLKTLVNKLQTGRINLEDPFHGTLDEVDSILFQFGVRTLNMDMLTQQQFSNFISKFGADLQPA